MNPQESVPMFPETSLARTSNWWAPSSNPVSEAVLTVPNSLHGPPSKRVENSTGPGDRSDPVHEKLIVLDAMCAPLSGPLTNVIAGPVESNRNLRRAGSTDTFPELSLPATANSYQPSPATAENGTSSEVTLSNRLVDTTVPSVRFLSVR